MGYRSYVSDPVRHDHRACRVWLVPHDVRRMNGYTINLPALCKNQNFLPEEVVSSELVFPEGAVPNSQLLWIRVELTSGKRKFITLGLVDFYDYISLPESSIGGWTDGDRGSDYSGLNARYETNDSGSDDEVSVEVQHDAKSIETLVEA